ncbi:MAG: winged helix-turn-helix transcriptional regulator, partial [Dactylosporangium sp.]|nr:winged helix-turn-helix transcriptional regulator [Dactylosporangium sp.]
MANSCQSDWTNGGSGSAGSEAGPRWWPGPTRRRRVELHITLGPRREHATRIYQQLLEAILDGRLREGDRLPATRVLAEQLAVSRTTVSVAYERLVAEGYLEGRVGDGTYVRPAGLPDPRRGASGGPAGARGGKARGGEPRAGHAGGDNGSGTPAGPRPRPVWD